jgi:hypothetical protein
VTERFKIKDPMPTDADMVDAIGAPLSDAWTALRRFLVETYQIEPFVQYAGPRYGWNIQHRRGGRPLAELYPQCGAFQALIILGAQEMEQALARLDSFGPLVQKALTETPRYHDGCWMYIRVTDPQTCMKDVQDMQELILIKKKPPKKKAAPAA